jgi:hypothetical protein
MPSPFTTTLEKFADNEKRIFDNKKNIYFLQACTESELEYLAEKKRHNTVAIDLSIFSKVTLEQAEYVSKMRDEFNINLVIEIGTWRSRTEEEFRISLVAEDGEEIINDYFTFPNEFLSQAIEPLRKYECTMLKEKLFEMLEDDKPKSERKMKI